ncbi:MAG: protein kinase domain-containing protein, partial [Planctomycetota bacterium]
MICPACENTIPDHLERCPICGMLFTSTGLALDPTPLGFEEDETTTLELPSDLARPVATPGEPGRYAILRRLGSGGMGVVYKVYDHKMERLVAVKRLNPQREKRGGILRFFSEAKAIARLNHPGIVSIFDIVEDRRGFFIVMELVRGISLRMWVKKHGALPPSVGAPILRQVAEALRYAHGRSIVHRDVKPGNILIGRGCVPKIVDFGVAVIGDDPSGTRAGRVAGTRGYIAPEVRWNRGQADPRADIYSFGMTALEIFSGVKPWLAKEYPSFASEFILYATRENPNDRFQNMEALLEAWEDVAERCSKDSGEVPAHVQRIL